MRTALSLILVLVLALAGFAAWLVYTPWGARAVVREITRRTLGARAVSWEKLDGSLIGGIRVEQLEVHTIPYLPDESFLRVQSFSVRLQELTLNGLDADVVNARLFTSGAEPIICNARLKAGQISGNVYTRALDLGNVRDVLAQFFDIPPFKGSLRDIDLFISGTFSRPDVGGHFTIERVVRNSLVLENVMACPDLHFTRARPRWETRGRLFLDSGWLWSSSVRIEIKPSILIFAGSAVRPELDIRASAKVARTHIDILVKGTRKEPQVSLTSDPSYPQEQLLLMLATGKRWSGVAQGTFDKVGVSPALASNFVDYLLFGGERSRIIRALGLSDISFNADEKKQGVTISKDITDRFGVGYGVEMGTDSQRQRDVTQRLQGEYALGGHFILGAQKEMRFERVSGTGDGQGNAASGKTLTSEDLPDDRVFLKYRTSF